MAHPEEKVGDIKLSAKTTIRDRKENQISSEYVIEGLSEINPIEMF
jgi:hypothetical protein